MKADTQTRVRLVGLWASMVAVVAVSVTVLADNHTAGFGRVIPRQEQMVLLLVALLLFVLQAIAYLISRSRRPSIRAAAQTSAAAPSAKTRS